MPLFFWFFLPSLFLFYWSNQRLIKSIVLISQILLIKEFVLSFLILGFLSNFPDFLTALSAVFRHVPLLSLGDVLGGNIVDLTLAVAIATFFTKSGLHFQRKTINTSLIFALFCALLPLLLMTDKTLSRGDGLVLLLTFFVYLFWLLSKKEKYQTVFLEIKDLSFFQKIKIFFKEFFLLFFSIFLLLVCIQIIISNVIFLTEKTGFSLFFGGAILLGLLNSLPETYFAVLAARQGREEMILGDLFSAVVGSATFVLGFVAFFSPFSLENFSLIFFTRLFLVLSIVAVLVFSKNDNKITKKEAVFLLFLYFLFIFFEFFKGKF